MTLAASTLFQRVLFEEDFDAESLLEGPNDYMVVRDADDDEFAEDYFEFPLWGLMISMFVLAVAFAVGVFYCSYKHERVVDRRKSEANSVSANNIPEDPMERGLSIKSWDENASRPFKTMGTQESIRTAASNISASSEDSSMDLGETPNENHTTNSQAGSSVRSSTRKSLVEMLAVPRCVLCSKCYEVGENVAHSNNSACHHDYHQECLTNYWSKNKKQDGNCPVCKETFLSSTLS